MDVGEDHREQRILDGGDDLLDRPVVEDRLDGVTNRRDDVSGEFRNGHDDRLQGGDDATCRGSGSGGEVRDTLHRGADGIGQRRRQSRDSDADVTEKSPDSAQGTAHSGEGRREHPGQIDAGHEVIDQGTDTIGYADHTVEQTLESADKIGESLAGSENGVGQGLDRTKQLGDRSAKGFRFLGAQLRILNELVNPIRQIVQLLTGRRRKDVLEALLDRGEIGEQGIEGIVERSEQFLSTTELSPLAHDGVSSVRGRRDHVAQTVADVRPRLTGLFEVAEDQLPCLGPSGTHCLLGRIDELGEGLHLRGRILRGLGQIHDGLRLVLGIALCDEVGFGVRTGELLQGLCQHVGGEPSALGQRLAERSVLLDHRVDVGTEVLGGALQGVLELLAAHAGIDHRVPIHQRDSTGRDGLRQLVHRLRGLGRARTRHGREVGDALDGIDRRLKVHTGGREGADVAGHLGEVIDRLIGVGVQRTQRLVHLVDRRSLGLGVRQDRLDRVELGLVFGEALLDRLDHAVGDLTTGVHRGVRDLVDH